MKKKVNLLTLFLLLISSSCLVAQNPLKAWDIPIIEDGDTLIHANAGGLNAPQFSEIDMNNDGILDLLVFDRMAQKALTFLNRGTAGRVDYIYAPELEAQFPQNTRSFMLARDYDGDGIGDLFLYNQPFFTSGGIGVMKGSYNADGIIEFSWVKDILSYTYPQNRVDNIYLYKPDLPAIEDIDGDGDLDIAAFTLTINFASNVYFYKNLSVENGYGTDSLIFKLQHECHGMFSELGLDNAVILSPGIDSCADNAAWNARLNPATPRHVGSSLTLVDWNNDGAMDLLMGDVSVNTLNMLTAQIVNDTIIMIEQDASYPSYDQPVNIYSYPSGYFIDVNNDGRKDFLAAPTEKTINEAVRDSVVWWYENTSNSSINLSFRQKDFLVDQMIDVSSNSHPTIVDVNGDGLLDIVLGHWGYVDEMGMQPTGLSYYENKGTQTAPLFELKDNDLGGFSSLNQIGLTASFGDLDGDDDLDLLLGMKNGTLTYVENIAGANNVMNWGVPQLNYQRISIFEDAKPQLVDLNRDGTLDIIAGNKEGRLYFFENTGNSTTPNFDSIPSSSTFGFDLVSFGSDAAAPHFVDNNGSYEMYLGHKNGTVLKFGNIDGNILGIYDTVSLDYENIWVGQSSSIAVADLDNDDTLDYVLGNIRGGLSFYNFNAPESLDTLISTLKVRPQHKDYIIYPNPTNEQLHIRWNSPTKTKTRLRIYDALGRVMAEYTVKPSSIQLQIALPKAAAGIYFLEVQQGSQQSVQSFEIY